MARIPGLAQLRLTYALSPILLLLWTLSGCTALSLRSRGAPDAELRTFDLDLEPVDLPSATHAHHGHFGPQPAPLRSTFPVDGWMHGFEALLVDADGKEVPRDVLHHIKMMAPDQRELFSPLMLRLVGAGAETGRASTPRQIGYRFRRGDEILVTAMLHNPTDRSLRGVRVRLRVHYTPEGPWKEPLSVMPFFTHVTAPGEDSSYDIPPGRSERAFEVHPAVEGRILALGGHLHRYGTEIRLEDVEDGRVLWRTVAETKPDGTIVRVPVDILVWSGGIDLYAGRAYRVVAVYDNPTGSTIPEGAMGTLGGVFVPAGSWPRVVRDDPLYRWDLERELSGVSDMVPGSPSGRR